MTGSPPPSTGDPFLMLGPSLPNCPYGGIFGAGVLGGQSSMPVGFCFPPAQGTSLPIATGTTWTLSSHSVEANVQELHLDTFITST